jgi:hypothetical protein
VRSLRYRSERGTAEYELLAGGVGEEIGQVRPAVRELTHRGFLPRQVGLTACPIVKGSNVEVLVFANRYDIWHETEIKPRIELVGRAVVDRSK